GILTASRQLRPGSIIRSTEFYGELGLDGELKAVAGMLLAAAEAQRAGREVLLPCASVAEVAPLLRMSSRAAIRTADHLRAVCAHMQGTRVLPPLRAESVGDLSTGTTAAPADLNDVRGQTAAKRALVVAAAGSHSLLMVGPPGAGKSMLAVRLATLLPPLTESEALEVAAIASASGLQHSFGSRPVRAPHHTSSAVALIGGGVNARPGEISLAHHGVLFLDEVLEYDRRALEALREPLECGAVTVSRAAARAQYPAQFQLVAAMNPCPCGRLGDSRGVCRCSPAEVQRYRARLSAPLLERVDIHLEIPRVDLSEFGETTLPLRSTAELGAQVQRARELQLTRQGNYNSRLSDDRLERFCALDCAAGELLARAQQRFDMSARTRQRILKLARTIADLEGSALLSATHVAEAVSYRFLDRNPTAVT
ncbi:MAG: YifB family Mg chelatase-like AAA ATPase, partial [Sinobacteraceae bacterium]|nr:YifB family Mg chelatase-like AAA ATPase [Nevskiaceae bacterium]